MPFIRPFEPKDTEACKHICRATLPPTLASDPEAVRMAPYIWCLQFLHLSPQTCFVLVDDDDDSNTSSPKDGNDGQDKQDEKGEKVVGYIIGTPDVFAFTSSYGRYITEVLQSPQGLLDVRPPPQLDALEPWLIPDYMQFKKVINTVSLAQHAYKPEWLVLSGPEGGAGEEQRKEMVENWRGMLHIDLLEGYQGKGWGRKMIERFCEAVKSSGGDYGRGVNMGIAGENQKVVKFYEKVGFRVFGGVPGEVEGGVWMVRDL
ncbi:hypothetical protein B0T20DRAFT_122897 [Sordaria brevicollis]|uniref:N-acetyltransferase domain-containing protein n=1 Tax=Sordaria brevicollis TaxID=83679 RepID=A0AAE0UF54_SORBR|nr:hypothetical protein B0T20DRAFT_122897 [Sordaria brevicollis]